MTTLAENNERSVAPGPFLDVPKRQRVFARRELVWVGLSLWLGRSRVVATVEPDAKWPALYRVHCAGKGSDMVNLTRARDAAVSIALAELNGAAND